MYEKITPPIQVPQIIFKTVNQLSLTTRSFLSFTGDGTLWYWPLQKSNRCCCPNSLRGTANQLVQGVCRGWSLWTVQHIPISAPRHIQAIKRIRCGDQGPLTTPVGAEFARWMLLWGRLTICILCVRPAAITQELHRLTKPRKTGCDLSGKYGRYLPGNWVATRQRNRRSAIHLLNNELIPLLRTWH